MSVPITSMSDASVDFPKMEEEISIFGKNMLVLKR